MKTEFDRTYFARAVELWADWNSRINVVSRKDIDNLYEHHILHSLAIAEYLERQGAVLPQGTSVLDLGTGGGFPGIPLAMVMPDVRFTLCDSIAKKIRVARSVCDALGLKNVECVNCRAESLPDSYDYVVSRAVTSLDNFYPWVRNKFRCSVLYLKGGDVNGEISSLVAKCRVNPSLVRTWKISDWLDDDYYAEKFVIEIGKNYLCTPNSTQK
ncbi:MAG: 16S rRNA (guanine(527)-N(7))-methyltransferase RsmG [Bacteroidales bacterium]|nr:16S rRNA (guanine(527)-N(7))-methyltransferase RsmG [Bacteroidales bacterium]